MSPPKVSGIEIPPRQLHELSDRQLAQMTPFERDAHRRLDLLERASIDQLTALEGIATNQRNAERRFEDHAARESKKSRNRAFAQPTIIIAILTIIGGVWVEKIKASAIQQTVEKADNKLDKEREKMAADITQGLSNQLRDLRTELEQQRRGYPQPLHQLETKGK
jgi:hypothetical protein